ncbi:CHAT domain-containing protein [Kovacikia minuta CCNUW1]|uniref:CHAT domain-containing protein n=1 Tax=Kovacikia minuta TaxID=2931930 RepID=UPI001CCC65BF|nr:CHAT domain-containing protein [Kovacikia minuta]UBF26128.1 CHAT domain-containing protein [Kovacikia minuta CCNUW1]
MALLTTLLCTGLSSFLANASVLDHQKQESPSSIPHSPLPTPPSSLLTQGKALYDAGQFAEAVKVLQQAVESYRSEGDQLRLAAALSNLSLTYQQLGAWEEAKRAIAESLDLLKIQNSKFKTQNSHLLAQSLDIQGRLQLGMGQTEEALAAWERATKIYREVGDRTGEIRSRINQAQALQVMGFNRRALESLNELEETLQPLPNSLTKVVGLRSLGDALQRVGDPDKSRQVLQQSLTIAQDLRSPQDVSAVLFSLGNVARVQQQIPDALQFYQQAANLAPAPILQVQAHLNRLSLLLENQQWAEAEALLPSIQAQIATLPPSRPAIYARINLAHSLVKLKDKGLKINNKKTDSSPIPHPPSLTETASLLATTVQQARDLGDRRAESYALGNLGGLYEQTRQWSEARSLTQQALLLAQSINATDVAYRWQWQLGRLLKQQGEIAGAIAAYESAVNTLQSLRSDLVAINREVQFTFRDSVEPIYRQTVELLLQGQGAQPGAENLDKARRLIESLQLAELDNFFREACLNAQSVLLDKLVDQDNPTTAIFYPIILDNRLDVILKVPKQPLRHHAITLPQTEVEKVLTQLQQALKRPDAARETRSLSQQVYNWLIRPVEADLKQSGVNTLVFVLDGMLRNIPMAALYNGQQYLVENYAVALSPGLQLFTPRPLAQTALNALTAGLSHPPSTYSQFSPLPEVKAELRLIEETGIPTTKLVDQNFTSQTLAQKINSLPFKVVHLATHGQFSSQAKNTFILAADGPINVNKLDNLLRSKTQNPSEAVELLVLSACQTAAGDNRATLGLAGVAVRAGARSTLASLWQIDDRSTAVFIGEFYRELATAKLTRAEALRRAQITLLKQYPQYNRPVYWAPYVLVGNWL